ncbi:MAG: hypothetical protein WD073_10505 [Xanthobacteraceae bacterium]
MSDNNHPERPRQEPEIIPPGRGGGAQNDLSAVFIRVEERDGVRRVYLRRPGPFSIVLALLTLGLVAAVVFVLLAGVVLIWIPIVVGVILLALLSASLRFYWQRLRQWWAGRG